MAEYTTIAVSHSPRRLSNLLGITALKLGYAEWHYIIDEPAGRKYFRGMTGHTFRVDGRSLSATLDVAADAWARK